MLELYVPELFTRGRVQRISAGDSVKNRAELMSGEINATENASDSRQTLATIWARWRAEPGTQLIPGHELAMRLGANGQPDYMDERKVAIAVWFSKSIRVMRTIDLCCYSGFGTAYRSTST